MAEERVIEIEALSTDDVLEKMADMSKGSRLLDLNTNHFLKKAAVLKKGVTAQRKV